MRENKHDTRVHVIIIFTEAFHFDPSWRDFQAGSQFVSSAFNPLSPKSDQYQTSPCNNYHCFIKHSGFGEQGWCSGESTRLPPMWPRFDSRTRRHMWVEFVVGSLLCSERFFSGYSGFPLSAKTNISKFQFDPECLSVSYMSPGLGRLGNHSSHYRA